MSDLNYSSDDYFSCNSNGGSSGNEADLEGEEDYAKEVNKTMMKTFNPYLYEPEKDVSDTDSSNESEIDKSSSEEYYSVENLRVGNNDWCKCGSNCKMEKKLSTVYVVRRYMHLIVNSMLKTILGVLLSQKTLKRYVPTKQYWKMFW